MGRGSEIDQKIAKILTDLLAHGLALQSQPRFGRDFPIHGPARDLVLRRFDRSDERFGDDGAKGLIEARQLRWFQTHAFVVTDSP